MGFENNSLKPLIKWVGGKRWLLPLLNGVWPHYKNHKLVEPFSGGMAVALGLNPESALLNDANQHLINLYSQVKLGLEINYRFKNESSYYYKMRNKFNNLVRKKINTGSDNAAIFYFLIKTGFNGLCRFNNSGEFNVPFGQHEVINYNKDFGIYQKKFSKWEFRSKDFSKLKISGNEFLYVDPPYDVEFTKYHAIDFTWKDQIRLAEWLAEHKGPIIASNQATKRVLKLYKDLNFNIITLSAPRRVSCNGDRKPALEMLAVKNIDAVLIKNVR